MERNNRILYEKIMTEAAKKVKKMINDADEGRMSFDSDLTNAFSKKLNKENNDSPEMKKTKGELSVISLMNYIAEYINKNLSDEKRKAGAQNLVNELKRVQKDTSKQQFFFDQIIKQIKNNHLL